MPWDSNKSKMTLMESMKCLLKKKSKSKILHRGRKVILRELHTVSHSTSSAHNHIQSPPVLTMFSKSYQLLRERALERSLLKSPWSIVLPLDEPVEVLCLQPKWKDASRKQSLPASDSSHHWIMCPPQVFSRELLEKVNIYFLSLREKSSRPEA